MKHVLFCLGLAAVIGAGCSSSPTTASSTTPSESHLKRYARKAVVLDVRTPEEYAAGHVTGSTNVPVAEVPARIGSVVPDKDAPVMVHCQSGRRSAKATQALRDMGYTRVYDLGSLAHAQQVVDGKE